MPRQSHSVLSASSAVRLLFSSQGMLLTLLTLLRILNVILTGLLLLLLLLLFMCWTYTLYFYVNTVLMLSYEEDYGRRQVII